MHRKCHNRNRILILLAGLLTALIPFSLASASPATFLEVDFTTPSPTTENMSADITSRHRAQLNINALLQHDSVTLNTHLGDTLILERRQVEHRGPEAFAWRGRVHDQDRQVGTASLTVQSGRVTGRFSTRDGRFRVVGDAEGRHWLEHVNPESMPQRHPPTHSPMNPPSTLQHESVGHSDSAASREGISVTEEPAVVDVIAYYTGAAVSEYPDEIGMRLSIRNTVDMANTALLESGIDHRFRLIGIIHWEHEEPANISDSLGSFAQDNNVSTTRNLYSADLNGNFGVYDDFCGIAYVLPDYDDTWNGAFSTSNIAGEYPCLEIQVLAHEMGHNMGLHHDPDNAPPPQDMIEPFAYGHLSENEFSTIMAYHPGCGGGDYYNCFDNDFFSNPAVIDPDSGLAVGIAGERDNAEVLRRTMPLAARWRTAPTSLARAAGPASMAFSTTGSSPWVPQGRVRLRDKPTLVSGPVYGEEESRLTMLINETGIFRLLPPRSVSFSVRGLEEDTVDGRLVLMADEQEIGRIDQFTGEWERHRFPLPEGTAELHWIWQSDKRPSLEDGLGVVFLGNIKQETDGGSAGCTLGHDRPLDPGLPLLVILSLFLGSRRRMATPPGLRTRARRRARHV